MALDMPRPRPPYLSLERTRHGKAVWYVRRHGKRVRLKADFGTPEFDAAYQAAIAGKPQTNGKSDPAAGTLAWLIARYRETTLWKDLSLATRRQRENIFKQVVTISGNERASDLSSEDVEKGRDRRAATPNQARHFLDAMRGLFRWAFDAKHIRPDPTANVKDPARPQTEGFAPWNEDDVIAYERRWPIGTPQRVWLDVLLYTGLRRGDAARLGRQHVKRGVATIATEKTRTVVALPILPVLQRTLDAGPCSDLTFIVGVKGKPYRKESFGNAFSEASRAAGVNKSCHGLRKIAATRCAENGATLPQMNAIFGWTGSRMALKYIEAANRKKLAAKAIKKMNDPRTFIVAPKGKVRQIAKKDE